MYEPGTILALKEPRSTEEEPFPYDRVKVIGASPIDHATGQHSEWEGAAGQGVIVQPVTDFGTTLDEPLGRLQRLYEVESVPTDEVVAQPIRVITPGQAGPTPEEVFAEAALADPPPETRRDERRDIRTGAVESPLAEADADAPKAKDSPLDE